MNGYGVFPTQNGEPGYYENPRFSSLPLDWCYTWATDYGAPCPQVL
jgi:hypothetical protein